jgi:hypothetical protein
MGAVERLDDAPEHLQHGIVSQRGKECERGHVPDVVPA